MQQKSVHHVQLQERSRLLLEPVAWTEIWETFEADLFGKQSIKGFHYSVLQRGHSSSLYNGILIHMHLLWQGTKSIVWQACSLLPGINSSLRSAVSIDRLVKSLLSAAALCWSAHSVIGAPKTQHIAGGNSCVWIDIAIHIIVLYL